MSVLIAASEPAARVFPPAENREGRFLNSIPAVVTPPGKAFHMLRRLLTERQRGEPKHSLGPFRTDPDVFSQPPSLGLRVTWIGHSSLLIEIDGYRILTDPVWSERVSFVSFAGPKRFYAPPLALADLPPLDAILISHDHYDHLDRGTIQALAGSGIRFVCSLGVGKYLESWGVAKSKITELNWGESASPGPNCNITAAPARHFSGRSLWNRNETLWSSFAIRGARHNIFFGADSGPFRSGFQQIGDTCGPFDLTMLEIGAYDADWPDIHMGPDHAVEAHLALRGKLLLPIHWGLFNLAFHPWREPVQRLIQEAQRHDISLLLPKPGNPTEVSGASLNSFWWEA